MLDTPEAREPHSRIFVEKTCSTNIGGVWTDEQLETDDVPYVRKDIFDKAIEALREWKKAEGEDDDLDAIEGAAYARGLRRLALDAAEKEGVA